MDHPLREYEVDGVPVLCAPGRDPQRCNTGGEHLVAELRARFGDLVVPVERHAVLTRLRELALASLPSVLVGSEAMLAIGDSLQDDEQLLALVRMTDSAGPGLLLVTDRAYSASSSPPERHDPVRHLLTELGEIAVRPGGGLSIETPAGTWTPAISGGDAATLEALAALLRARPT